MKIDNLVKKVIVWRLISVSMTLVLMYLITGDGKEATGITFLLHAVLTACHYAFEKYWKKVYGNQRDLRLEG